MGSEVAGPDLFKSLPARGPGEARDDGTRPISRRCAMRIMAEAERILGRPANVAPNSRPGRYMREVYTHNPEALPARIGGRIKGLCRRSGLRPLPVPEARIEDRANPGSYGDPVHRDPGGYRPVGIGPDRSAQGHPRTGDGELMAAHPGGTPIRGRRRYRPDAL